MLCFKVRCNLSFPSRAAGSASRGETEQLQRVLADQRRENQVLTEEIHQLNTKLASTAAARDRDSLQADKNGMAGAVQALQLQLAQLQTADTRQLLAAVSSWSCAAECCNPVPVLHCTVPPPSPAAGGFYHPSSTSSSQQGWSFCVGHYGGIF